MIALRLKLISLTVTHVQARALESHAHHINQRAESSLIAS